ncbi:hypothetical protein [Spirosoma horti]
MTHNKILFARPVSHIPNPVGQGNDRKRSGKAPGDPSRKPDWLLIVMGVIFLLTFLIAWLVNVPNLWR